MNDTDPAVFESYLKKYPDGEFSDLAKIKISNLKKNQKNETLRSSTQPEPQPESQNPSKVHAELIQDTISNTLQSVKSISADGTSRNLTTGFVETFSEHSVDSTRWEEWNQDNTKLNKQYGNGLILSGGSYEKAKGGIVSKFYLLGNFEIEVSFEIIKWPIYENPQLDRQRTSLICLYTHNGKPKTDRYAAEVKRYNSPADTFEGYAINWATKGIWQSEYLPKRLNHSYGKLRLKRTKRGKFEAFYDDSGSWQPLPGYPDSFDMPVMIGLSVANFSFERKVAPTR